MKMEAVRKKNGKDGALQHWITILAVEITSISDAFDY